jgi:hypothetical protein
MASSVRLQRCQKAAATPPLQLRRALMPSNIDSRVGRPVNLNSLLLRRPHRSYDAKNNLFKHDLEMCSRGKRPYDSTRKLDLQDNFQRSFTTIHVLESNRRQPPRLQLSSTLPRTRNLSGAETHSGAEAGSSSSSTPTIPFGLNQIDYASMIQNNIPPPKWPLPPPPPRRLHKNLIRTYFPEFVAACGLALLLFIVFNRDDDNMHEYWKQVDQGVVPPDDDGDDDDDEEEDD